jgi:predicted AAA+ superfamily ATPase
VYELGIVPALLRYIRERSEASWSTTLTTAGISDGPGLAEIVGVEPVPTHASERLNALMRAMPCGSIGLSGPRGVGKTTLITKLARSHSGDHGPAVIGLRVSAPTKYDGRDFVLYLFGCLCD